MKDDGLYNPLTPFKPIILHNPGQYDCQADVSCKWSPKDFQSCLVSKLVSSLSLRYEVWSIVEMLSLRHDTLITHSWLYYSPGWVKTDLYNDPLYAEYALGALPSSESNDVSYWNCSQRILSKAYVHAQSCLTVCDPRDCNRQAPLSM